MSKTVTVAFVAFAFSVGTAHGHELVAAAPPGKSQALPGMQRTVHSKTDLAGVPGREAIVLTVDGVPGLVGKRHFHPGDEFLYILSGSLKLEVEGKAPVTLKKGETLHIPAKAVHRASNPSSTSPFKVVTFGVFEKGQPDTTIVGE